MDGFGLFAILAFVTGFAEMINARYLRLPSAMALVLLSLFAVVIAVGLDQFGIVPIETIRTLLPDPSSFKALLIDTSLAFMLFAAAIGIDPAGLRRLFPSILFFATVGVMISVVLVAHGTLLVSGLFGIEITLAGAYLFGAIISPTDPMAINRITEGIRGNRTWSTIIQGESLFNDAFALVAYTLAAGVVFGGTATNPEQSLLTLFLWEVLVSIGIGLGLALVSAVLLTMFGTNERDGRVLASIGLAAGSYALAAHLGASGPIAVVTTGLAVMWGFHHSKKFHTLESVRDFWSMSERGLASMFFLLIGLEVLVVDWTLGLVVLGIAAWAVVFFSRFLTVILGYLGSTLLYRLGSAVHFITPLTVGGVRGSISVALALSLPVVASDTLGQRKTIIALTFGAVVIGLLLQSGALALMARKINARQGHHPKFRHGVRSVLVGARQKRHRSQRRSRQ